MSGSTAAGQEALPALVRSWCGSDAVSEWDREAALRAEVETAVSIAAGGDTTIFFETGKPDAIPFGVDGSCSAEP